MKVLLIGDKEVLNKGIIFQIPVSPFTVYQQMVSFFHKFNFCSDQYAIGAIKELDKTLFTNAENNFTIDEIWNS